ncbi:MAG TPA: response regulator [Thermoleophilaceae bacterium]|nr:response regulator [Thermoleophilaceae bacterium]
MTQQPPVPILIVDDNPAKRLAIKAALAPLAYHIREAESGLEALRCVMAQDFAVILLDVRMPIMDGFETAARIRERPRSEVTPIIFITSHASDEMSDTDRYSQGAVDFIFAPVPPEELRSKVSVFANLFSRAEELAAQAGEVQKSADQLRLLTEAAPIGIFQTDHQNRYLYTNPRWSEITGITQKKAEGQTWDHFLGEEERGALASELSDKFAEHAELSSRFVLRVAGKASRIVLLTSKRIPDSEGGEVGWVGTLADVTAEAGAEAAMSDARDKATEASRQKSDFLANMSHEIRTPMNGVLGMTDLLLETDLDARQLDYAQTVRNSGEALLTIIEDILDFSKVEAGKLEVEDVQFELRTVVDEVVNLLAVPAHKKGLEVMAVVGDSVPRVVSGDPGRVRQVLTNLIGNAVKFTQAGEILVRAEASEVENAEAVVRFEVCDTGDGIAPDKLEKIFHPFVQGDSSTSRKYGGTGLGLAISGQLVALMGGACGVSSHLGKGSDFWFTIRVNANAGTGQHKHSAPDLAGIKALVVDDNATQRSVLSDYLTGWGMTVEAAATGQAALDRLRLEAAGGQPFAVALLDLSLPDIDGLQLAKTLAADPDLGVRSVLMTVLGQAPHLEADEEARAYSTLSKPIHRQDLLASLRDALGVGPVGDAIPELAADHPAPVDPTESALLLLAEDNLVNQKVALAMLSGAGYRVDTVLNGAEAVRAVAAQPYDAILMDCQMPELNGYEATAAIRAQEGDERHTPIIAVTAGARREDRERCLEAGMDAYLSKPVSKDTLLALVARSVK